LYIEQSRSPAQIPASALERQSVYSDPILIIGRGSARDALAQAYRSRAGRNRPQGEPSGQLAEQVKTDKALVDEIAAIRLIGAGDLGQLAERAMRVSCGHRIVSF
jgi:hypothetical protein